MSRSRVPTWRVGDPFVTGSLRENVNFGRSLELGREFQWLTSVDEKYHGVLGKGG